MPMSTRSMLAICAAIVCGLALMGMLMQPATVRGQEVSRTSGSASGRYQMMVDTRSLILLDTETGRYWIKHHGESTPIPVKWSEESPSWAKSK